MNLFKKIANVFNKTFINTKSTTVKVKPFENISKIVTNFSKSVSSNFKKIFHRDKVSVRNFDKEISKINISQPSINENDHAIKKSFYNKGVFTPSNDIMKDEIRRAAKNESDIINSNDIRIFYRATQKLWENEDPRLRNEIIMKKLGYDNLQDVINDVINSKFISEDIERALQYENVTDTSELSRSDENDIGSPTWITQLSPIDFGNDENLNYFRSMRRNNTIDDII